MFNRSRSIRALAAIGLIAAIAVPAAAGGPGDVTVIANPDIHTTRVGYGDLNLTDRQGRAMLYHRVRVAAHFVCNPGKFDGGLSREEQAGCYYGAMDDAWPQMNRAVRRAEQIAATGHSSIAVVTLAISARF